MAVRATGSFNMLRYEPGNPQFPTLPDGVPTPHVHDWGQTAGLRARVRPTTGRGRVRAAAPADDDGRYAGWQDLTTWINPAIVDFGVIPSPVQRTFSLYNARPYPITVTAISLPTGVSLIGPSLPVTLFPYAGDTFTLEASTTGDATFDTTETITTSEGDIPIRLIGRRVFNLENIPQMPQRETLFWKTDLVRSRDGTEKAYSLVNAPNVQVDYRIFYDQDDNQARMKLRNQFIAGESALIVSGQKWYEMRPLYEAVQSTDTFARIFGEPQDASWAVGDNVSMVDVGLTKTAAAQVNGIVAGPDADYLEVAMLFHFDGSQGDEFTSDSGPLDLPSSFNTGSPPHAYIDTTQSVFGGSSLYMDGNIATTEQYLEVDTWPDAQISDEDFTIEFWFYAQSFSGSPMLVSQWNAGGSPSSTAHRGWRIQLTTTDIRFAANSGGTKTKTFPFGSPEAIKLNQWHHVAFCRTGGATLRCYVDGVQLGTEDNTWNITLETGDRPLLFGQYRESGYFNDFQGWIDEFRMTIGQSRYDGDFTVTTTPFPGVDDIYTQLNFAAEVGDTFAANDYIMPVGLGYVSRFPSYSTHRDNLEIAEYSLTFNQEADFSNLDTTFFPTLTDLQSPQNTLPVLEFKNIIKGGGTKGSSLKREEDALDSGLSNRIAYTWYPFADEESEFAISIYSKEEMWAWRRFFHYLRGSYGEFFVPTFTNDIPGVTTSGGGNTFTAPDTDVALLFGDPPDPRRNAIRLEFDDGTIEYRMITAITDNGATEDYTVSAAVSDGTPKISFMQRSRILGDTVTIEHERTDYAFIKFRYRTILK